MFDPFMISAIIIAIAFLVILVLNHFVKSKMIRFSFLLYAIIFIVLLLALDVSFIKEFLTTFITYFYYPNYLFFTISVLFSSSVLVYTLIKKNMDTKVKCLNYLLFIIHFASYLIYQRLNIDINVATSLYSANSLLVMRIVTISSIGWFILNLLLKLINLRKKSEEII